MCKNVTGQALAASSYPGEPTPGGSMKRTMIVLGFTLVGTLLALAACQQTQEGPWFAGSFDDALQAAGTSGNLVFVEFYSPT
jgi:hypothetical protein